MGLPYHMRFKCLSMLFILSAFTTHVCSAQMSSREPDTAEARIDAKMDNLLAPRPRFNAAISALAQMETFTTPPGADYLVIRSDKQERILSFASGYRQLLVDRPPLFTLEQDQAFAQLVRPILDRSFDHLIPLLQLPNAADIHLIIDFNNRNAVLVRLVPTGRTYIISLGIDFLRLLSEDTLVLSTSLKNRFLTINASFASHQLDLRSIFSEKEFAILAPQLSAQNQLRGTIVGAGGVRRGNVELLLGGIRSLRALNSPHIPNDLKIKIMRSAGALGLDDNIDLPSLDESINEYLLNDKYLDYLHYLMFNDIISYIVAHELSHVALQHVSGTEVPGSLRHELDADKLALEALFKWHEVDVRAIVLAMASFSNLLHDRAEIDGDHPYSADRLRILFSTVGAIKPNLMLDVEAGQALLPTRHAGNPDLNLERIEAIQTMSHAIRLTLAFSRMSETEAIKAKRDLAATVAIDLVDPADPGVSVASSTYSGQISLDPATESMVGFGKAPIVDPRGSFTLRLPSALWTRCPTCSARIRTLHVYRAERQMIRSLACHAWNSFLGNLATSVCEMIPRWDADPISLDAMLTMIDRRPQVSILLDRVLLARTLFREGRLKDCAAIYKNLATEASEFFAPDDYFRWVACLPKGENPELLDILRQAAKQYPTTGGIQFLIGLLSEEAGDKLQAVDAYFLDINKFTEHSFADEAALRLFKPLAHAPKGSLEAQFKVGLMVYMLASDTADRTSQASLFDISNRRFEQLSTSTGSFAAMVYAAETRMYLAFLKKRSLMDAQEAMTRIVKLDPLFLPAYGHLARLAICQGNEPSAVDWIVRSFESNVGGLQPIVESALQLLDHKEIRGQVCESP